MPDPPCVLLAKFISEHGLTLRAVGETFGVSDVTVLQWRSGASQPRHEHRLAIEAWTRGLIKADAWLSEEDREQIARCAELAPTGTTA